MKYKYRIAVLLICFVMSTYALNAVHNGLIAAKFNSLVTDYNDVVNKGQYSSNVGSQRFFIWSRTLEYIFERPILGSGPDTFEKVFKMSSQEAIMHFNSSDVYVDKAHNEYLQILVTMGFPALIFYLSFLAVLCWRTVLNIKKGRYGIYTVCFFGGILAYLCQGFFNISVVSVAPVYWSVLGMLLAVNKLSYA